jgi:hypothetical protein
MGGEGMLGTRQQRLLTALASYPGGVAVDFLLAAVGAQAASLERRRTLGALRRLAESGWLGRTGDGNLPESEMSWQREQKGIVGLPAGGTARRQARRGDRRVSLFQ